PALPCWGFASLRPAIRSRSREALADLRKAKLSRVRLRIIDPPGAVPSRLHIPPFASNILSMERLAMRLPLVFSRSLSAIFVFAVSQMEEVVDAGANNSTEKALEVKLGQVINAKCDGNQYKYYKIALKPNERIVLDCQAERIDSRMNPTVVMLNPAGKEVTRA